MRTLKIIPTLSFILVVLYSSVSGQTKFDTLSNALQNVVNKDSLPGMSVLLVNAKHVIYHRSFGYADVGQKLKYTSQSIQNIGSVSKTIIAVALMKALEPGYFNLETDINTLLPFKVVNPNYPNGIITIRQLSNHTSGVIDNPVIYSNTYQFDTTLTRYDRTAYSILQKLGYQQKVHDSSLKDFIFDYLSLSGKYYRKENFAHNAPGTSSSYSNIASALAAYLIEVKSGMSYAKFTERYILKPLKMNNSGWFIDIHHLENYARPYYDLKSSFPFYHSVTYPDGGLRTNTNDLGKYLVALINGYNGDNKLLNSSSYKTMFTPQFSKENLPEGLNLKTGNKGIFWNLYNNGTIGHDGDDPGVSSFLFFNPKTGLGGVFLCNKYLADKSEIINLLVQFTNAR